MPESRWGARWFDPDRRVPDRSYSRWAALLPDLGGFDPRFFQLSPMEAEAMDPQQRQFLQQAWTALEDAGYATPGSGAGAACMWGPAAVTTTTCCGRPARRTPGRRSSATAWRSWRPGSRTCST